MNMYRQMPFRYSLPDDVVFKRHECEWILPTGVARYLRYNPRHVPAIIFEVKWFSDVRGSYVHIIENMRSDYIFNRRVFAAYGGKDVYNSNSHSPESSVSCTYLSSDWSG